MLSGFRLELMYISLIINIRSNLTNLHCFQLLVQMVQRNHFFLLYEQGKSSESKAKFTQAGNTCIRVLEAAKLAYADEKKESITFQKLAPFQKLPETFGILSIVFSTKVNLL